MTISNELLDELLKGCQRHSKFPQKCRSKIPHFLGSAINRYQ